jgi:hypothetical protein
MSILHKNAVTNPGILEGDRGGVGHNTGTVADPEILIGGAPYDSSLAVKVDLIYTKTIIYV